MRNLKICEITLVYFQGFIKMIIRKEEGIIKKIKKKVCNPNNIKGEL